MKRSLFAILFLFLPFGCHVDNAATAQKEVASLRYSIADARKSAQVVVDKLTIALGETNKVSDAVTKQGEQYVKLQSKWYVKIGVVVERLFWGLVIGIPLLLMAAAFGEVFGGGIIATAATGVFHFVPPLLALPFRAFAGLFDRSK